MVVQIDYGRCIWNRNGNNNGYCLEEGGCVGACSTGVLYRAEQLKVVEPDNCTDCRACVDMCGLEALSIVD